MKELVINDITITTDSEGRFSLNDLHKAAGNHKKHEPFKFYRSHAFEEVVKILKHQKRGFEPIVKVRGRYNGGTWVCKELVYKYAMWVSAEFEVNVIQTFDKVQQAVSAPSTMKALNDLTLKIQSDEKVASFCGRELARYKKVKKKNEEKFMLEVMNAQLTLGFKT